MFCCHFAVAFTNKVLICGRELFNNLNSCFLFLANPFISDFAADTLGKEYARRWL